MILIIKNALATLADVPIYVEDEPTEHVEEFILLKSTEDSETEHIGCIKLAIECYSTSTYEAYKLCNDVRTWMAQINSSGLSKVQFNTSYKDNDTTKKRYRYRAAFTCWSF